MQVRRRLAAFRRLAHLGKLVPAGLSWNGTPSISASPARAAAADFGKFAAVPGTIRHREVNPEPGPPAGRCSAPVRPRR